MCALLDVGYTDCLLSMAASCGDLLNLLQYNGFRRVGVLRSSVKLINDVDQLTDNIILIKNVGITHRPVGCRRIL